MCYRYSLSVKPEIELNSAALLIQALFHSCDYSPVTSVIIRLTEYSSIKITKEKKHPNSELAILRVFGSL